MTPLTPEQLERVDALRNLDKVTLAVKLVRAQDALSVRPEAALTSDSEDALRLSHIRNAYYEWRGGSINIAQFHGVLAEMVAPKSRPQEQR